MFMAVRNKVILCLIFFIGISRLFFIIIIVVFGSSAVFIIVIHILSTSTLFVIVIFFIIIVILCNYSDYVVNFWVERITFLPFAWTDKSNRYSRRLDVKALFIPICLLIECPNCISLHLRQKLSLLKHYSYPALKLCCWWLLIVDVIRVTQDSNICHISP